MMRIISTRLQTTDPDADEAQHAFATAIAFQVASVQAEETKVVDDKFQRALVPAVVCAALSVELGMKARIIADGNRAEYEKLRGKPAHNLATLFSKLSEDDRHWFISGSGLNASDFMVALHSVSDAFVDWRYVYEKTERAIDFDFLRRLSQLASTLPDQAH